MYTYYSEKSEIILLFRYMESGSIHNCSGEIYQYCKLFVGIEHLVRYRQEEQGQYQ
jgi:hypothetical protein